MERDRLSWGGNSDGKFTVKSAYELLLKDTSPRQNWELFYKRIWGVSAPERVKIFIWLVGNQVIMTNVERNRRHLCASGVCQVCKQGYETIIHVLRDCPAITGVWSRIVQTRRRDDFFQTTLLEWLFDNLGDDKELDGNKWSTLFAMTVWWAWKWRCENVFGSENRCRDRVKFVKGLASEVTRANILYGTKTAKPPRSERMIGWSPPSTSWMKLNTDGASHGNAGPATAAGVIRDESGNWEGGFVLNIGRCSAPLAELWGVYYGLWIAWEKRIPRLELEVDSEIVVTFLKTGIEGSHPLSFLVRLCHGFLLKDWIVQISHVYREANRLADGLANYAFSLPLGFVSLSCVPDSLVSIMEDDANGVTQPRHVLI